MNSEHLTLVRQGPGAIAAWRREHPTTALDLSRANLGGADLGGADLSRANLGGADLSRANLIGANLGGANLSRADLSRADLIGADLGRADLSRANLSGAYLIGANLSRANLSGANLSGANLSGADLSGANLSRANLSGAYLGGANLSGANLSGAIVRQVGPLGSRRDYLVLVQIPGADALVRTGCWSGTLDELAGRVEEVHGNTTHGEEYRAAIAYLRAVITIAHTPASGQGADLSGASLPR